MMSGQPYFSDLKMHRFGERWYRPEWGRFLTPDPLGFVDGPNRYAYAGAQPMMYIDPSGFARRRLMDGVHNVANYMGGFAAGVLPLPLEPTAGREEWFYRGQMDGSVLSLLSSAEMGAAGFGMMEAGGFAFAGGAVTCLATAGGGCVVATAAAPAIGAGAALTGAAAAWMHHGLLALM